MSKSLADRRANPPTSRPERSRTVCTEPHITAEVQRITAELAALPLPSVQVDEDGERDGPPRKAAKSDDELRADQLTSELKVALDRMAENEDEFRTRAKWTDGEWRRWVDKNPPRPEGKPGHERDKRIGMGSLFCNTDALIETLGSFMHTVNGELMAEGDWETLFEPVVSNGDKADFATDVLGMYEGRTDFQQWRSGLSGNLKRLNGFAPPATSASVPASSMDESSPNSTSTSTPAATSPE